MPRQCQLSGKRTSSGNKVSHSNRKTRRSFKVNLIKKWVYISHENAWKQLIVSTRALKTLNKRGVVSILKKNGMSTKILKKAKTKKIAKQ